MILYCYYRYLQSLLEYMESYVHRIKPLLDIQQVSVFHLMGQPTRYWYLSHMCKDAIIHKHVLPSIGSRGVIGAPMGY